MSDALDRLRNRQRPTVPNRDAILHPGTPDVQISGNPETKNNSTEKFNADSERHRLNEPLQTPDVSMSRYLDTEKTTNRQTKQSTLRLEAELSDRLQQLCRERLICREVLIEAMFEYCETNPSILEAVLGVARQKNEYRQEVANRRRAESMMKRFGDKESE